MRKLILILIILLSFSFVYADDMIEEYIEIVENGTFSAEELNTFRSNNDHEALELFLTAHVSLEAYDYKTAYESLEAALLVSESDLLNTEILYYLAMIDLEFNDKPTAITRGLQLKELSHESNNLIGVIRADHIMSLGYLRTFDYDEARAYAEEALNLSRSIGYDLGIWEYYIFVGTLELYQDDFDKAKEHFDEAKTFTESHELKSVFYDIYITTERSIASAVYWQNRENKAIERLVPLLDLVSEENALLKSQLLYQLGRYTYADRTRSQDYLEQALDYYNLVPKKEGYNDFVNSINELLAFRYYASGDYKKSSDYFYIVSDYYRSEEYAEATIGSFEDLDQYKYDEVTDKIILLEELADTKSEQLATQKRMLFIFSVSMVLLTIFGLIIIFVLKSRSNSRKELYINSITDPLTDVYNRSRIIEIFESKLEGNNAVILLDLDNFKNVNDQFGHLVGDEVLKDVADILKHSVRGDDVVGRYGGGEFLIILDYASQDECRIVAERIRQNIETIDWAHEGLLTTCSVGVTRVYSKNADEVLHYVDSLMHQAKTNGKNQVVYG